MKLVEQFGLKKWSLIGGMLPGRVGKQCRERWFNHLRPNIKVTLISLCFYAFHFFFQNFSLLVVLMNFRYSTYKLSFFKKYYHEYIFEA